MSAPNRDPETWQRINDLFHRAIAVPADQREALVLAACPEDSELRREVLSLVSAHERTGRFIETPTALTSAAARAGSGAAVLVGMQLEQYRIDRVLGEGGMGVVYLAEDLRLRRTVALKAVSPQYTDDPRRRERLVREARAAAALTHPGIAGVYALEEIAGAVFIAGEYVPGITLRDEFISGRQPARRTLATAIELAQAIAAAHDRGVVHRDLKPENVIRTPEGHVKILDFGLAQMRRGTAGDSTHLTQDGMTLGTPAYMSPEQIRHQHLDARSDLFSLGIVLWEMLTGGHPFAGADALSTTARILEGEPARPQGTAASGDDAADLELRHALEAILLRLLRKPREERFASAHDLLTSLDLVRNGQAPTSSVPTTLPLWWWKFHQAATSLSYALLLIPVWTARVAISGRPGLLLFLAALAAAVSATVLRLHLWFTASSLPAEWHAQRAHVRPWMRVSDGVYVLALAVAGLSMLDAASGIAELLVGAAVVVLLGSSIIEPATTRAAFGRQV